MAQSVHVIGRVTSAENGEAIPGVLVTIDGNPNKGGITLADGTFTISAKDSDVLIFNVLGYEETRISIAGQRKIEVKLTPAVTRIEELVVVGYGTMKKSDVTGAVASVSGDVLKKSPVSSVSEALQGRLAGVTVTSDTGQPGSGATVRIRGIGSITQGNAPLFVVDGMIVGNNINFLSPNDIASTEVLKDASSAAIFGSQGANGVILITTKTGKKSDRMNIAFESYYGVQNRWNKLDLMGRDEFIKTYLNINSGFGGTVGSAQIASYESGGINNWLHKNRIGTSKWYPVPGTSYDYSAAETDWQDEVFVKNAAIQNHYLSFNGGSDRSTYALSANYFSQDGTILGSRYDRLNFRLNSSFQARKWLKIGETLSFATSRSRWSMNNNSSPGASVLSAALAMGPWDPAFYPSGAKNAAGGDLGGHMSTSSLYSQGTNPFAMERYSHNRDNDHIWLGSLYADAELFKGFTWHSDLAFTFEYNRKRNFEEAYEANYGGRDKNSVGQSSYFAQTLIATNYATYARTIKKHDFSVMAGHTASIYKNESVSAGNTGLQNTGEDYWMVDNTTGEDVTYGGKFYGPRRTMSFISRLFYQFAERYMVTVNFRADADRAFRQMWGYFPSFSAAWRVSEESWLRDVRALTSLKLRLGWGQLGNGNVSSDLSTMQMFTSKNQFVGYPLGTGTGDVQLIPSGAAVISQKNLDSKWERTEQINAGLDFALWQNKLSGTVDFFVRDTRDMLLYRPWPHYAGVMFYPMDNIGVMRNSGVEFALEHQNSVTVANSPLSYSIGGNMSFIRNKVLSTNGADRVWGMTNGRTFTVTDQGYSVGSFWGYEYEGIYRSQEEIDAHLSNGNAYNFKVGDARYKDLNGDGRLDDQNDMKVIGNPFPKFTYGVNLQAAWHGVDLQMFFQGVYGNTIYNALRERTEGSGTQSQLSTSMRDVWTEKTPNGSIPNPLRTVNFFNSSRFLEDGSYFRLKNAQLGYTLPAVWMKKAGIERVRFYLSSSNLFTVTKYSGYDPEVGGGVDFGNYPQSRTFMLGVNINF